MQLVCKELSAHCCPNFSCTMEWCSLCPLCWVRLQVSPIGWARWCMQHNWQRQGHSIRFRCGVADSMIKKMIHVQQTHEFCHYYRVYDQPPQTLMTLCLCFLCCIINAKLCTLKHWNNSKWDVLTLCMLDSREKMQLYHQLLEIEWFLMEWGILYPKTLKLGGKTL
jgi:hypothetical protein